MGTLNEYRERRHWSYSALSSFLACSLKYAFEKVYQIPRAFTPVSLSFGNAFHRTCEWLNLVRLEGQQPGKTEAVDLFGTLWDRQVQEDRDIRFDEDMPADACSKQGRDMVACLVDAIDPEEQVLTVNECFAVPLVDALGNVLETPMIGEIDTVVEKTGHKALVDYKTAARRWPKDKPDKDLQPTVFLYGYHHLHGELPGFEFQVVVKNAKPVFERHETSRTADHFARMVELVKVAEKAIAAEAFIPNEQSFFCASCCYAEACRNWHHEHARVSVRMAV